MDHVPITFEHNGKKYAGSFSSVHGAGQNEWHLVNDKNFYLGALRMNKNQWVFHATPKTQELSDLADFFGEYLIAWVNEKVFGRSFFVLVARPIQQPNLILCYLSE